MTLGPIFFAAPAALLALIALPLLYWILRATPPAPVRAIFPPLRILLGIRTEEESKKRAPWWLLLLRALAAALAIIGFARPTLAPQANLTSAATGPSLIVIDDGWTSAPNWLAVKNAALSDIAEAERTEQPVALLTTAPTQQPARIDLLAPADARARLQRLQPKAWRPDRAAAAGGLSSDTTQFAQVLWIHDGLAGAGDDVLTRALLAKGPVRARGPTRTARAVTRMELGEDGINVGVKRASRGLEDGVIAAETAEGRSLGATTFRFSPGAGEANAQIKLPPEIAARAARVRLIGETSAGAMRLTASGAGRTILGLIDAGGQGQPLLSDLYYVERAVQPFAVTRRGPVTTLIDQGVQALVLPDASRLSPPERKAIDAWIDKGGLLIRFAGPRLANDADDLLPVRLRVGARNLGGALGWEKPQTLQAFDAESPFAGLSPPADLQIRRQVLADPTSETGARVWARLQDGAPIITAAAKDKGLVVLFHVTGGPEWSNLPLTGLYVDLLKRTLNFAGRAERAADTRASGPFMPERLLDGFGALTPASADARPITPADMSNAIASPSTPPGVYARAGGESAVIDAAASDEAMSAIQLPVGIAQQSLEAQGPRPFGAFLLTLALLILMVDLLVALFLVGRLPKFSRKMTKAAGLVLACLLIAPVAAFAQAPDPDILRLAYVRSGEARTDRIAASGLEALNVALRERTAVEPGPATGIDLERDDLSLFPLIYWLAPETPRRLSDTALARLDAYMRQGGMVFIDTRDADRASGARATGAPGPAAIMLQGIDAPPLEVIGEDHVLARAFYLMRSFPGRFSNTRLYGEAANAAASRDGVASLFVGNGDWASAWANSLDTGARQDELAIRFGVNLVMVALTGNYKADQVHVPALLERMGREQPGQRRRAPE